MIGVACCSVDYWHSVIKWKLPLHPRACQNCFLQFLRHQNPRTYAEPDESLLLQAGSKASISLTFNFTEWWKVLEGENLSKPFDIGDKLVAGLLCALETVSALFYMQAL
jgi:hypothetical protein